MSATSANQRQRRSLRVIPGRAASRQGPARAWKTVRTRLPAPVMAARAVEMQIWRPPAAPTPHAHACDAARVGWPARVGPAEPIRRRDPLAEPVPAAGRAGQAGSTAGHAGRAGSAEGHVARASACSICERYRQKPAHNAFAHARLEGLATQLSVNPGRPAPDAASWDPDAVCSPAWGMDSRHNEHQAITPSPKPRRCHLDGPPGRAAWKGHLAGRAWTCRLDVPR
jgi:hypothetical protein